MSGETGAGVAASVTGAGGAMILSSHGDLILTVAVPIVASWFGLVGIGVLASRPFKQTFRQLGGAILLGGVVAIVALACITAVKAEGVSAAIITLTIAVAPAVVWRTLGEAGPRVIDGALSTFGLQRKDRDDGN